MYARTNTHSRAVVLRFLHTEVVSMTNVFVGASAFKYAKKLAAWNITKVSTGCGTSRDQSCMKHMLGEYNNLDVWATLNSCDRKTLWNAWYDIELLLLPLLASLRRHPAHVPHTLRSLCH